MKKNLPMIIRVLISALFLLSAFAKMYPSPEIGLIKYFEYDQLIYKLGFNEVFAQYLSRSLIAFEIFIAISIMQSNYLKRLIIPTSILLLLAFSLHLSYSIFQGDNGNCGCFGDLIPMTPIQALIKNIVSIAILVFLYKKTRVKSDSNMKNIVIILLSCMLFMFIYVPLKSNSTRSVKVVNNQQVENKKSNIVKVDSIKLKYNKLINELKKYQEEINQIDRTYSNDLEESTEDLTKEQERLQEEIKQLELVMEEEINNLEEENDKTKSIYSNYIEGIDDGEKLLCFFAAGCDHCQLAAEQITKLSNEIESFPNVFIVFMNEELERIPDFFEIAGSTYDYQIMEMGHFIDVFWFKENQTPGVVYLNNGNIIQFYQGSKESGSKIIFNPDKLKQILENR